MVSSFVVSCGNGPIAYNGELSDGPTQMMVNAQTKDIFDFGRILTENRPKEFSEQHLK